MCTARVLVSLTRACLMLVGMTLSFPAVPAAAFDYPDTRAGRIAEAHIAAFNSADGERIREFEAMYRSDNALAQRSLDERIPRVLGLYEQVGQIVPGVVKESSEYSITLIAKAEGAGMWVSMTYDCQDVEPHKLETVRIVPSGPPETETAEIAAWDTLEELLQQFVDTAKIPAMAVAVVKGSEIEEFAVVGVRAVGLETAAEPDDMFHIGSVTKSVTATMIGRLVEDGALSWDVTLAEALADVPMKDAYRDVTLWQLLHHLGGIQPYTMVSPELEKELDGMPGVDTDPLAAITRRVLMEEPGNPVGQFNYSNAGYAVIGYIAERATGKTWRELVQATVLTPLDMTHSSFGWPATGEMPNAPRGHYDSAEGFRTQNLGEYDLGDYIDPAGDVSCSIEDLARYAIAHLGGLNGRDGILAPATFEKLHTAPEVVEGTMRYACGWIIDDDDGVHWHNGSAGTFYARVEIYPDIDRAIVFLTNVGFTKGEPVSGRVVEEIRARFEETAAR